MATSPKCTILLLLFICFVLSNGFGFNSHILPAQSSFKDETKSMMMLFGMGKKPIQKRRIGVSEQDEKWVQERVLRFNSGAITAAELVKTAKSDVSSLAPAIQLAAELVKDKAKRQKLLQALETYERGQNTRTSGISSQSIGDRYELQASGTSVSSGKSRILNAFEKSTPGTSLKAKISKDKICIEREVNNMKILRKTERGRSSKLFVNFVDTQYNFDGSGNNAIIMENGSYDLKTFVEQNGPIQGSELRKYAIQIARILDTVHRSGLVWTDCKLDNLVFFNKQNTIKAVDLEGAVPIGTNLVGFSAEITPPYAARDLRGEVVKPEFDSWSF